MADTVIESLRATDGGLGLSMLRWGLIPAWAKDPAIGYKLINARSETAAEKPSFRSAYRHCRCLIPADGFYEWERWTVPGGAALTGSLAESGPGDSVETCTILTTAANDTVAAVHGRMPVILPRDACDAWLSGEEVSLTPYPADAMTGYPVSTLVNKPANDDPRCVEPVSLT